MKGTGRNEVNIRMKRNRWMILAAGSLLLLGACANVGAMRESDGSTQAAVLEAEDSGLVQEEAERQTEQPVEASAGPEETSTLDFQTDPSQATVTEGTQEYRDFLLDNVLHSANDGDIHYSVYIPDSYDGSEPYAVFFTLPGYEGLYFQGVGENLYSENFAFEAMNYNLKMIIVAPQLSDWGETSARQTIALVEYFLCHYNIDPEKVYAEGYSGGGETMSQVMGMRPELFTAYLQCSSQWDGAYEPVVESRTPVYLAVGESDEYYGSGPSEEAYENLYGLYRQEGLSDEEIRELLVLDVKDADWFESRGWTNQHGGGGLFASDEEIMGWLFDR